MWEELDHCKDDSDLDAVRGNLSRIITASSGAHEPVDAAAYFPGQSELIKSTVRSTSTRPPSGPTTLLATIAL